jgi:hypothetical protein
MLLHFNSDFSTTRPGWEISFTSEFEKTKLELRVFLEGPFKDSAMTTDLADINILPLSQPFNCHPWNYYGDESVSSIPVSAVDWILIELRDTTEAVFASGETVIARQAAFLSDDGTLTGTDGLSTLSFNRSITHSLYVVVRHRNHLSIMSANPLSSVNNIYYYDFTTGTDKVFGGAAGYKQLSGTFWGMATGDFNSNGKVDSADISVWKLQAGEYGYYQTDVNHNSEVDNKDKNDFWLNNYGMESQVPE